MTAVPAYAAPTAHGDLEPTVIERRGLRDHDIRIDIQYCGVCHTDIHQVREEWGEAIFPMVPGHEIVGIVTAAGPAVSKYAVGQRVGVGCFVDSCRECENCVQGEESSCTKGMVMTYNSRDYDGEPTYGGYSAELVVDENYAVRIPDELDLGAAAPLLCAGIIMYGPLKHWNAGPGKRVAIIGMGGLGHIGVKIAHAMGAEVTVLGHSLSKRDDALAFGANDFRSVADSTTFDDLASYFDLIINTVSVNLDTEAYLNLLRFNGTMVTVGIPDQPSTVGPFTLLVNRRSLAGSQVGGVAETQEMLDFCAEHDIAAEIELIDIADVNKAYQRVLDSDVRYRFVIDLASLPA